MRTSNEEATSETIAHYASCAEAIVGQICRGWGAYVDGNFWRVANAFTTLIDYLEMANQPNLSLGKSTYDNFIQKGNGPGWWYDDYGWWIVALLRADDCSRLLGTYGKSWRQLAGEAWSLMAPAKDVWARANKEVFAEAEPRFDGGCWNHDLVQGDCNPLNPCEDGGWPVCGFQNAVTNAQFLTCAARMSYAADARRAWGWLANWFSETNPELPPDQRLLASYPGVGKLARERVSTYASSRPGNFPSVHNYRKDRHWAGDQGILLGALAEMVRLDPVRGPSYYATAKDILSAVPAKLANGQILQPWTPPDTIPSGFATDYSTGVGVFMRYLLYVYRHDSVLGSYIASNYQTFVPANADAVCNSVGTCPPLPDGSSMDDMECLLNQLAVLNAAIAILPR